MEITKRMLKDAIERLHLQTNMYIKEKGGARGQGDRRGRKEKEKKKVCNLAVFIVAHFGRK